MGRSKRGRSCRDSISVEDPGVRYGQSVTRSAQTCRILGKALDSEEWAWWAVQGLNL